MKFMGGNIVVNNTSNFIFLQVGASQESSCVNDDDANTKKELISKDEEKIDELNDDEDVGTSGRKKSKAQKRRVSRYRPKCF